MPSLCIFKVDIGLLDAACAANKYMQAPTIRLALEFSLLSLLFLISCFSGRRRIDMYQYKEVL